MGRHSSFLNPEFAAPSRLVCSCRKYGEPHLAYNRATDRMSIPDAQTLLLPVLQALADGRVHSSVQIRERVKLQFDIAPNELLQKLKNGTPVFHNRVAWALAHLNMRRGPLGHSEAIEKVRTEVYKITEHGKAILERNPSALTIKDL